MYAYPHAKQKSNLILISFIPMFILTCFELILVRLTTATWNDRINLLLLLTPYHMQKNRTSFIFVINLGMSAWPHPLKATIKYLLLYGPLVTSKNSTSYLNFFVRYSSLKNPAFWLAMRFLDNWRSRFIQNMLFL